MSWAACSSRGATPLRAALFALAFVVLGGHARGEDGALPVTGIPGEVKQKAAELEQALNGAKAAVLKELYNKTIVLSQLEEWLQGNKSEARTWLQGNMSMLNRTHAAELHATKEMDRHASVELRQLHKDQQAHMASALEILVKGLWKGDAMPQLPKQCGEECQPCKKQQWWQKLLRRTCTVCMEVCRSAPVDMSKLLRHTDMTLCGYHDDRVHSGTLDVCYKVLMQDAQELYNMTTVQGMAGFSAALQTRWGKNDELPAPARWMYAAMSALIVLNMLQLCCVVRCCGRDRRVPADFEKTMQGEVESIQAKLDELLNGHVATPGPPPIAVPVDNAIVDDANPEDLPSWVKGIYPDRLYIRPESPLIELVFGSDVDSALKEGSVVEVPNGPPVHTAPGGFGEQLTFGDHVVQPFVGLGQSETDPSKRKRLALRAIIVTKTREGLKWQFRDGAQKIVAQGEPYPNYADLQLQHTRTVFADKGVAKANATVRCELTFKGGFVPNNKVSYKKQLDAKGRLELILAPEFVTLCEVHGEGIALPPIKPVAPPPKPITDIAPVEDDVVDHNAPSALPDYKKDKAVFMCDVSGSMGSQIEKLRQGLRDTIERYCTPDSKFPQGRKFSIVLWDNNTEFPHGQTWQQANKKQDLLNWVSSVNSRGGTNMQQSFDNLASSSLAHEVRYIVMMCDGDVNVSDESLRGLKNRGFPELQHVSFVAFGNGTQGAPAQRMKELSKVIGQGAFYAF